MALGTTGISATLVANTIGVGSNDVGTLCTSNKINKWSKKKPVSYQTSSSLTDAQLKETNYGFNITSNTNLDSPTGWSYVRPTGGMTSPYRLGDFRGYNHEAKTFIWVENYIWDYYTYPSAQSIEIYPAFMYGYGSGDGQGGAGGGNIDLLPKDFNLTNLGGSFENFYMGVYHKAPDGTTYYAFSNITIGQTGPGTYLKILLTCGEGGITTTGFTDYLNGLHADSVITLTPFLVFTQSYTAPKYCFPNGQTMTITKKNVHAEAVFKMWAKLNVFGTNTGIGAGGTSFYDYTLSSAISGSAFIYETVGGTTTVNKIGSNSSAGHIVRVQIGGPVYCRETVTVKWKDIRAHIDGLGTGNYLTPTVLVNGTAVDWSTGSTTFTAGQTATISFTDYINNAGNLLSTLPTNATYITAAKPKAGLISYDVLSYVDSANQKFGFMCLGQA